MSLLLTGSRDQALLTLVVQEASAAARDEGCFVGRTALQKLMYFLNAMDVPMGYRFDIHHYGPYCDDISRDADWLMADEVLTDRSNDARRYSNYAPGPAADELIARHSQSLEPWRASVQRLVRALVPMRPEKLELIATLDYLYRFKKASGGSGPWKPAVVTRFLEVKGEKFPPEVVEQTYDAMSQVGLLDP